MKKVLSLFFLFFLVSAICYADRMTISSGGSGGITAVGNITTGAAFTSGVPGQSLIFKNATSGTITFQTITGALGTRTISLPAETGTVCTTGSVCSGYQATQAAVTLAGTPNYLTLSGQEITLKKLDILDDTNATGGTGVDIIGNDFTLDTTEVSSNTWGAGSFTTMIFDAGVTDPVFTFGSNVFSVSTGNVGIGTTGPAQVLHVVGAGYFTTGLGVADTNITSGVVNVGTGFRIANAATSRKILVGNGTNFIASTETWAVPGISGNVLTSDGTNWVSSASVAGDNITVNTITAADANFLDNLYVDWALNTATTPDDITSKFNYAETLAGNPALLTTECVFTADGLLCEGTTADTIELKLAFPDPATTDKTLTLPNATDTLVGKETTDTLTNKIMTAAANVIDADTAVALAANGANCSAGNYPLGVDSLGAVESCAAASLAGGADTQIQFNDGGTTLAGTSGLTWNKTIGALSNTVQPAFLVHNAGAQSDMSAAGIEVTIVLDTELFDQGNDFATNTFTAPVTGRYELSTIVSLSQIDSAATALRIEIKTSNRNYSFLLDPRQFAGDIAGRYTISFSILADMDVNDTVTLLFAQDGGTAQVDITNGTDARFSGFLAL